MAQDPNQPFQINDDDLHGLATTDPQRYHIYQSFLQSYGRAPTPNEVAQYRPIDEGQGLTAVQAAVANQARLDQMTPEVLAEKEKKETATKLPQYTDQV